MDFYDYLVQEYGYDEPIILDELKEKLDIKPTTLRQRMSRLVLKGQVVRIIQGVYFIPKKKPLFGLPVLDVNKVVHRKYLRSQNQVTGYNAGVNFANYLGLTSQTASVPTIVTNKASRDSRSVKIYNNRVIIRKPRVTVNEKNYKILQVLDLLNNYELLSEKPLDIAKNRILSYLGDVTINENEMKGYLNEYPGKTKVRAYELGLVKDETTRTPSRV